MNVGGIVGSHTYYNNGSIVGCSNSGDIKGGNCARIGGIVGYGDEITVSECYNTGKILNTSGNSGSYIAGVTATDEIEYKNIDNEKPVISIGSESYKDGEWTNKDVVLTPENTTANLGTTTYRYKAGNQTVVTIFMKPTESLADAIEGITLENVTSAEKDVIETYIADLDNELANEYITKEEKDIVQKLKEDAEALSDRIEKALQAADIDDIKKAEGITEDTVIPADKKTLESAKEAL